VEPGIRNPAPANAHSKFRIPNSKFRTLRVLSLSALLAVVPAPLCAQDAQAPLIPPASSSEGAAGRSWAWSFDANVFSGYNYQQRRFADFSAWESQNWFMAAGARRLGAGQLQLEAMLSLEPLTVGRLVFAGDTNPQRIEAGGSPQLYQTGESYHQAPLVNYQHPHDLIMTIGGAYRIERRRVACTFAAALVGSPALGPVPFMHRESARSNPQVPLAHHALDSTHATPGVLTAAIAAGSLSFEASAFRGAEPDENRLNLERPRLDSWSGRIGWHRGGWRAQVSGGHLREPEWFEPWDNTRLTASVAFDGAIGTRPLSTTLAWGRTIEYNGFDDTADSYLLEWDLRVAHRASLYGRAEQVRKQIFGLGFHPRGLNHRHTYSDIGALTIGYLHDLLRGSPGTIALGGDITGYRTSADLSPFYGSSRSYHLFFRWRPNRAAAAHVHALQ
jgi:hypothetical protein